MTGWLKDIPQQSYLLEMPADPLAKPPGNLGTIVITHEALDAISCYATSTPTGPSAGRVYRRTTRRVRFNEETAVKAGVKPGVYTIPVRDEQAVDVTGDVLVYVVIDEPDGDGQLHVPCRALVVM